MTLDDTALLADGLHGCTDLHDSSPGTGRPDDSGTTLSAGEPTGSLPRAVRDVSTRARPFQGRTRKPLVATTGLAVPSLGRVSTKVYGPGARALPPQLAREGDRVEAGLAGLRDAARERHLAGAAGLAGELLVGATHLPLERRPWPAWSRSGRCARATREAHAERGPLLAAVGPEGAAREGDAGDAAQGGQGGGRRGSSWRRARRRTAPGAGAAGARPRRGRSPRGGPRSARAGRWPGSPPRAALMAALPAPGSSVGVAPPLAARRAERGVARRARGPAARRRRAATSVRERSAGTCPQAACGRSARIDAHRHPKAPVPIARWRRDRVADGRCRGTSRT